MWTDYEYLNQSMDEPETQHLGTESDDGITTIGPSQHIAAIPFPNQSAVISRKIIKARFSRGSSKSQEWHFTRLVSSGFKNAIHNDMLTCDVCNHRTRARENLIRHMKKWHMGKHNERRFSCDICGIRMAILANLRTHMLSHSGTRPHPCTFQCCQSRFFSSSDLKIHMRMHLGDKPYKCDECADAFISKSALSRHIKAVHSDHYAFTCEVCGKQFKFITRYKDHFLTHCDPTYECGICGKSFRKESSFKFHMNIHLNIRPYKCSVCKLSFHSTEARRTHVKSVHNL